MRVLLIEDSPLIVVALTELLQGLPTVLVVGYALTQADALVLAAEVMPDLVILDLRIPSNAHSTPDPAIGLATIHLLHQQWPRLPILIFSSLAEVEWLPRAVSAGACGFLTKGGSSQALVTAIEAIQGSGFAFTTHQLRMLGGVQ